MEGYRNGTCHARHLPGPTTPQEPGIGEKDGRKMRPPYAGRRTVTQVGMTADIRRLRAEAVTKRLRQLRGYLR